MKQSDVKLRDALKNLRKALESLSRAIQMPIKTQRDVAGIIKNFEFTYELTWLALKRYLATEGVEAGTPRVVFSTAYREGILQDEQLWLQMMEDRNLTVHTYDEDFAKTLASKIVESYVPVLQQLFENLSQKLKM